MFRATEEGKKMKKKGGGAKELIVKV